MRALDPLLLELFDGVYKELSAALETELRRTGCPQDESAEATDRLKQKIARLKTALTALQGAMERRDSSIVH